MTKELRNFYLWIASVGLILYSCNRPSSEVPDVPTSKTFNTPLSDSSDQQKKVDLKNQIDTGTINSKDIQVSGIALGDSINQLIEKFGKPDSVTQDVNEFNGDTIFTHHYVNSFFEISGGRVDGFTILDRQFFFGSNKIRIGDNDKILQQLFPSSYKKRYEVDESVEIVRVQINNSDEYLLFGIKENKIISYETWVNW